VGSARVQFFEIDIEILIAVAGMDCQQMYRYSSPNNSTNNNSLPADKPSTDVSPYGDIDSSTRQTPRLAVPVSSFIY